MIQAERLEHTEVMQQRCIWRGTWDANKLQEMQRRTAETEFSPPLAHRHSEAFVNNIIFLSRSYYLQLVILRLPTALLSIVVQIEHQPLSSATIDATYIFLSLEQTTSIGVQQYTTSPMV